VVTNARRFVGWAGNDTITGGMGNDTIYGQGSRSNTIVDAYGDNTIYAGNGGDTITVGNSEGVDDNNQVFGGAGNDRITVGNGNEWVQGGSGNEYIQGGSGNDWLFGGSGNDTIIGGTGMDYIQGGGGQNTLYGHGEHDVLDGVPSADAIHSQGSGLASDQVYDVPDYCDVQHGGVDLPTASDANANYGEYCYYTPPDPQNLSDANNRVSVPVGSFTTNSGFRLGESLITQAAIYGRWDPSASAPSGSFWTHDAWYSIYQGTTLLDVIGPVNESDACGTSGQPWQLLSGSNALPGGTYNLIGTVYIWLSNYNPNNPNNPNNPSDNGDGGLLYVDATMLQPIWPTVCIKAVGQGVQPTVAPADPWQYAAWQDTWQPIQIPVWGDGDRAQVQLHAAINQIYSNVTDWSAVLPNIDGLEFWTAQTGGTQLNGLDANENPIDSAGDLIDQSFSGGGTFDQTVWVSEDPTYVAENPDDLTPPAINFYTQAEAGSSQHPVLAQVADCAPTAAEVSGWTIVGKGWQWNFAADHSSKATTDPDMVYRDCYAKANGTGSTLQQLAIAITGDASDAPLVEGQLNGQPIEAGTEIDVAPLLARFEDLLRTAVGMSAVSVKHTHFGHSTGNALTESTVEQVFTGPDPFANGIDCKGMARVILADGLIRTLDRNQAGPNGSPDLNEYTSLKFSGPRVWGLPSTSLPALSQLKVGDWAYFQGDTRYGNNDPYPPGDDPGENVIVIRDGGYYYGWTKLETQMGVGVGVMSYGQWRACLLAASFADCILNPNVVGYPNVPPVQPVVFLNVSLIATKVFKWRMPLLVQEDSQ
jgi:hypothetical protein